MNIEEKICNIENLLFTLGANVNGIEAFSKDGTNDVLMYLDVITDIKNNFDTVYGNLVKSLIEVKVSEE